jgi:hypothetical protein
MAGNAASRHSLAAAAVELPVRKGILPDHFPKAAPCRFPASPALCKGHRSSTYPFIEYIDVVIILLVKLYRIRRCAVKRVIRLPGKLFDGRRYMVDAAGMERMAPAYPL